MPFTLFILWARINQSNLLGAMSRRPKQLRRIRRQDYNGVSDGKYKVSVISLETGKSAKGIQIVDLG